MDDGETKKSFFNKKIFLVIKLGSLLIFFLIGWIIASIFKLERAEQGLLNVDNIAHADAPPAEAGCGTGGCATSSTGSGSGF